jgi:outer membrane protein OmpA-like peptidoglycan-associated protein
MDEAQLAAPVTAFFSALELRDREMAASMLSPDVRLGVPSVGLICTGRDEVLDAIGAVLIAFPDFRYRVRSRYVAPDQVTDEALLEGTRTGPLLDSPPSGAAGTVPARVILTHDGDVVTAATLWADAGALRELVELPETLPGAASPLVSRLRATLPAAEGRLILAQERDSTIAEREPPMLPPQVAPPARPRATRGGDLKVPVPRKVRRLQAAVLALLMVGASFSLVAWVVSGTVRTAGDQQPAQANVGPDPTPSTAAQATTPMVAGPNPEPVEVKFDETRNEFELSSDALFFDTNSAELTPQAQTALAKVVAQIRKERRYGRITVNGYTDKRGGSGYNKRLSQARADAVAATLRKALGNLVNRVTVVPIGHGEEDPIVTTGTTPEELAPNRRVTIQVPKPGR